MLWRFYHLQKVQISRILAGTFHHKHRAHRHKIRLWRPDNVYKYVWGQFPGRKGSTWVQVCVEMITWVLLGHLDLNSWSSSDNSRWMLRLWAGAAWRGWWSWWWPSSSPIFIINIGKSFQLNVLIDLFED